MEILHSRAVRCSRPRRSSSVEKCHPSPASSHPEKRWFSNPTSMGTSQQPHRHSRSSITKSHPHGCSPIARAALHSSAWSQGWRAASPALLDKAPQGLQGCRADPDQRPALGRSACSQHSTSHLNPEAPPCSKVLQRCCKPSAGRRRNSAPRASEDQIPAHTRSHDGCTAWRRLRFPPRVSRCAPGKYGRDTKRLRLMRKAGKEYLIRRVLLIGLCTSCFMPLLTDLMVHHLSSPLALNLVK